MRIGVLGTGMVGRTIATRLVELGHEVKMGSRSAGNEKAVEWASGAGEGASEGSFADATSFGEVVFNCTPGAASVDALGMAGPENLSGKVLIDVSNPLDFSKGMPPTLSVCNDDSVGEQIQREFPDARVVKSLNTVNASIRVDPPHGDHVAAQRQANLLLEGPRGELAGALLHLRGEEDGPRAAPGLAQAAVPSEEPALAVRHEPDRDEHALHAPGRLPGLLAV